MHLFPPSPDKIAFYCSHLICVKCNRSVREPSGCMHLPIFSGQADSLSPATTLNNPLQMQVHLVGTGSPSTRGNWLSWWQVPVLLYVNKGVELPPMATPSRVVPSLWLSLGTCGRKCHHTNRYSFRLPLFLFSLTAFHVPSTLGLLSSLQGLSVSSWENPWPLGLRVPPVQRGSGRR